MLTDSYLKNLKLKSKAYKVSDRDGLYAVVLPSGSISFCYNYQINGRNETVTLGLWKKKGDTAAGKRKVDRSKKAKRFRTVICP